jgi:hypothetical protein
VFISTFLPLQQHNNGNVGTCQMRFTVTVTLCAAHSELVAVLLNTGWFRGEFNILQGNYIGHCEKERAYDHVSNFEWLLRQKYSNLRTHKNRER